MTFLLTLTLRTTPKTNRKKMRGALNRETSMYRVVNTYFFHYRLYNKYFIQTKVLTNLEHVLQENLTSSNIIHEEGKKKVKGRGGDIWSREEEERAYRNRKGDMKKREGKSSSLGGIYFTICQKNKYNLK